MAVSGIIGCASKSAPVSDVDSATALINATFNEWKAGSSLDDQRKKEPPVYVAEELWLNGTQLSDFKITEPAQLFGTNVRIGVRVTTIDQFGSKLNRDLKYLVTTTPALTIAREDR